MYCIRKITDDVIWVGGSDRRLSKFENAFPVPRGVSYNSYLVTDEKTVLLDTVDKAVSEVFFENISHVLRGRKLDYLIVNHMEPDHSATLAELVLRYPEVTIVCTQKAAGMIANFFPGFACCHVTTVKENDTLFTGKHTFRFLTAPMVHWPEVMVTYDKADNILFSADAFGTFGAINGNLFADEVSFEAEWLDDARRYYTNIVGKYGPQVQALLKKAAELDIRILCPLHGPVWRENIGWYVEKYQRWSTYTPEERGVIIAYGSIYGHTENAADLLAARLAESGVRNVREYDVSVTDPSYILSDAFRFSHLIFASATYNNGIFSNMETLLTDLIAHRLENRTAAVVENGSWSPAAGGLIREKLSCMKNFTVLENTVTIRSALKEEQLETLNGLAKAVADSLRKETF